MLHSISGYLLLCCYQDLDLTKMHQFQSPTHTQSHPNFKKVRAEREYFIDWKLIKDLLKLKLQSAMQCDALRGINQSCGGLLGVNFELKVKRDKVPFQTFIMDRCLEKTCV